VGIKGLRGESRVQAPLGFSMAKPANKMDKEQKEEGRTDVNKNANLSAMGKPTMNGTAKEISTYGGKGTTLWIKIITVQHTQRLEGVDNGSERESLQTILHGTGTEKKLG